MYTFRKMHFFGVIVLSVELCSVKLVTICTGQFLRSGLLSQYKRIYSRYMWKKEKLQHNEKGEGSIVSTGLLKGTYSRARSHYCPTRVLLAARFPSWPGSLFLRQPGCWGFLDRTHVDAELSADTCSTQATFQQEPQSQTVLYN